jgi:hypothetical protein
MVQELLPLLPKELGTLALVIALSGTVVGAALWLMGARFSRTLITLLLVSGGAWVGMLLPRWRHWPIEGWATGLGGAVICGAAGFFMHRLWVGLSLGLVLAGWAAVVTWLAFKGDGTWTLPKYETGVQLAQYGQSLWESFPDAVRRIMPFACGTAMLSGLVAALMWPRVGVVLLYSCVGVSMILGMGLSAVNLARPQWVGNLPAKTSAQVVTLLAMVAFGALLQWRIGPGNSGKQKARRPMVIHD